MNNSQLNSESTLGADEQAQAILRSFRACWHQKQDVRAEDYASQCPKDERDGLIIALLQVEIEARQKRGEIVEISELESRFPHLRLEIRRWLTQCIGSKDRASSSTMVEGVVANGQTPESMSYDAGIAVSITRLGRYLIKGDIGRGAFGEVLLAEDPNLDRPVAIKVPRPGFALSPQIRRQFIAEGRKVAKLNHPNIVSVYDAGEADGRCYIVSQYIPGGNLRDRIRQGPLSVDRTLDIAKQIAEALHYAHEQRIVHRDIKPANILLTDQVHPMITDFGLAKFESGDQSIFAPGSLAGTPAYMAPEQALDGVHSVDCRADIFSLGIIISEMLTGIRPQVGSSPEEWQAHHQRGLQITLPSTVRDDVPAEVDEIVSRATSRDLTSRFSTARELALALGELQRKRDESVIQPTPALPPASRKQVRHWIPAGGLMLSIAVIALAVNQSGPLIQQADDGRVTVKIRTAPEGAKVTFIPLETDTHYPQPREAVESQIVEEPAGAEITDLADLNSANREMANEEARRIARAKGTQRVSTARLHPGHYLLVTEWDEGSFHEVYRTIPKKDQTSTGGPYSHMYFRKQQNGVVRLPDVVLRRVPNQFRNTTSVQQSTVSVSDPGGTLDFQVPSFRIMQRPVSLATARIQGHHISNLRTASSWNGPSSLLQNQELLSRIIEEDGPLVGFCWDDAVQFAENNGMRLPDELECRAFFHAATNSDSHPRTQIDKEIARAIWTINPATSRPGAQCYDNSFPRAVRSSDVERVAIERIPETVPSDPESGSRIDRVIRRFIDRRDGSDLTVGLHLLPIDAPRLTAAQFPQIAGKAH
ncbi:MAG: serine/threonine-protein kinase [Planctomycetaceae bacterium]